MITTEIRSHFTLGVLRGRLDEDEKSGHAFIYSFLRTLTSSSSPLPLLPRVLLSAHCQVHTLFCYSVIRLHSFAEYCFFQLDYVSFAKRCKDDLLWQDVDFHGKLRIQVEVPSKYFGFSCSHDRLHMSCWYPIFFVYFLPFF